MCSGTPPPNSIPQHLWLTGMRSVKLANQIPHVVNVICWLPAPAYVVITGTLDKIMHLVIARPRIVYLVDFQFRWFLICHSVWFATWLAFDSW